MAEPVRLRILFEDGDMLNKSQRKNGLKRSWIHLKPNHHKTIHDFASHLTRIFDLHHSYPSGLLLSMDGFVLPFFESTRVLKDNDLICVKKKNGTICATVKEEQEIVEKQPLAIGVKLLTNAVPNKETRGCESELEENDTQSKDTLHVEDAVEVNVDSKKRKASGKLGSSEKKKKKKRTTDVSLGTPEVAADIEHEIHPAKVVLRKRKLSDVKVKTVKIIPEICKRSDANDDSILSKKSSHLLGKDGKGTDVANIPDENNKLPSRSARRKKAKRQWLRQSSMLEKKELNRLPKSEKDNHQSSRMSNHQSSDKGNHHSSEKCNHQSSKKCNHQSPEKDNHQSPKKCNHQSSKKCNHQSPEKDNHQSPKKCNHQSPNKDTTLSCKEETPMDIEQECKTSEAEEEVVPVVVRPGHIRFEVLGKASAVQQNETPVDNFQWNGITSKKKGQKWGSEKGTYNGSTNYIFKHEDTEMRTTGEKAPSCPDPIDFDKLMPYAGLPERGDVIAYRLIELSSSWCPEVSPFRVGKILQYDSETSKVILESVPEYPFVPKKKLDEQEEEEEEEEEASAPQLDTSLYGEDGSLEIEFPSLIDVRVVKNRNMNAAKKVKAILNGHANENIAIQNTTPIGNNSKGKKNDAPPENGGTNTWDEISEALSAKKAQLVQDNDWQQKNENSSHEGRRPYRVLRGSALGPTMAILRAQNAL